MTYSEDEYIKNGRTAERERIIKLLEADKRELSPWEPPLSSKVSHNRDINRFIALIKGGE
jgi:hypothetical protein